MRQLVVAVCFLGLVGCEGRLHISSESSKNEEAEVEKGENIEPLLLKFQLVNGRNVEVRVVEFDGRRYHVFHSYGNGIHVIDVTEHKVLNPKEVLENVESFP